MREVVYYDEETVHSILSQFGEGIVQKLQIEENALNTDTVTGFDEAKTSSGLTMNLKLSSGSLPGGEVNLGGNFGGVQGVRYGTSQTLSEGQKDIIEKIFHDHALELLLQKLEENSLIGISDEDLKEGDFSIINGNYQYYDFELYKRGLEPTLISQILGMADDSVSDGEKKEISKFLEGIKKKKNLTAQERAKLEGYKDKIASIEGEKTAMKTFNMIYTFSNYVNNLLEGLVIFKIDNYIVIAKKELMRIASEALSFRTDSSVRKIKILGKVTGKKGSKMELSSLLTDFHIKDFDKIPAMFLDVMLGALEISNIDDVIINPIAIYYEEI